MASSVSLGDKLEQTVERLVATGRYNSKSEVLREGVRLVEEREKRLALLDAALDRGLADAREGRVASVDEAFADIRRELKLPR